MVTIGKRVGPCALCHREANLTFHHLIPKKMHRRTYFKKNFPREVLNNGVDLCRLCHRSIHRLHDEMTLAKNFYTLERLQGDLAVQRHVNWVRRQKEKAVTL